MRDVVKDPGNEAPSYNQHDADEDHDLCNGEQQNPAKPHPEPGRQRVRSERVAVCALQASESRKQHEREHHCEVFHDQPADGYAASLRLHQPALLHGPEQHHGACDRQGKSKDETGANGPSHEQRETQSHQAGDNDLNNGTGQRYRAHRQKVVERKVKPNAKHQ